MKPRPARRPRRSVQPPRPRRERRCRSCGCTDRRRCLGGCSWWEADLCTSCRPVRLSCPRLVACCLVVAIELCQFLPVGRGIKQAAAQVVAALRQALHTARPGCSVVVSAQAGPLWIVMQTLPEVLPELDGRPAWMRRVLQDFIGLSKEGWR